LMWMSAEACGSAITLLHPGIRFLISPDPVIWSAWTCVLTTEKNYTNSSVGHHYKK